MTLVDMHEESICKHLWRTGRTPAQYRKEVRLAQNVAHACITLTTLAMMIFLPGLPARVLAGVFLWILFLFVIELMLAARIAVLHRLEGGDGR